MLPTRPLTIDDLASRPESEIIDFEDRVVAAYIASGSYRHAAQTVGTSTRHAIQIVRRHVQPTETSGLSTIADVDALVKEQYDQIEEVGIDQFSTPEGYFGSLRETAKVMMRIAENGGDRQSDEWVLDGDLGS